MADEVRLNKSSLYCWELANCTEKKYKVSIPKIDEKNWDQLSVEELTHLSTLWVKLLDFDGEKEEKKSPCDYYCNLPQESNLIHILM